MIFRNYAKGHDRELHAALNPVLGVATDAQASMSTRDHLIAQVAEIDTGKLALKVNTQT